MRVLFRADASRELGTGHVMRCLALADRLRERGAQSHFVCRAHPGHLGALIERRGHGITLLPLIDEAGPVGSADGAAQPVATAWLGPGIDEAADAHDTLSAVRAGIGDVGGSPAIDWWVVDHYALGHRWESLLRPTCQRLMVIDDLADRRHDCDLLLDQNLGRRPCDYATLMPDQAAGLIGPGYALLRPEFAQWRPYSLRRRAGQTGLKRLLIAMGGVDKDDATGKVLTAIAASPLVGEMAITVVLGANAPWLEQVRNLAARIRHTTEVLTDVANMAQLMSEADLAIGAAGGTAWERCCLGLPSVLLVLAPNQRAGTQALAAHRAAVVVEAAEQIPDILNTLSHESPDSAAMSLSSLSHAARSITDGQGAARIIDAMTALSARSARLVVRRMREDDLAMVLAWRNHPGVRQHMLTQHEISMPEHVAWFARARHDPSRCLLIAEENEQPLGFVQFSNIRPDAAAEWGFYAVPGASKGAGRKLGMAALAHAFGTLGLHKVCGQAVATNQASIKFHQALGFQQEGVLREQHFIGRHWRDIICFGLLASEWSGVER